MSESEQWDSEQWVKKYRERQRAWKAATMSFSEACAYLGLSYGQLNRAFQRGQIQVDIYQYGCPRRFTKAELDRYGATRPGMKVSAKERAYLIELLRQQGAEEAKSLLWKLGYYKRLLEAEQASSTNSANEDAT